jgi:hypothetical protein
MGDSAATRVAEEAGIVAAAWSQPDAPASWRLTAAQFEALRDDPELRAIAATIPPDRLPPLLFQAAATALILELEPEPLRACYPRIGEPQPPVGPDFATLFREFCLEEREPLLDLCARHRYQMNEVGRSADVVPALPTGRELALVDIGTGAGLGLQLDRYRYRYHRGGGAGDLTVGAPDARLQIETELRGRAVPPVPAVLPKIVDRVGIDTEPLDLADPEVRTWLAACVPQEIDAVTRFHAAAAVALEHPARTIRGDAVEVLPAVLDAIDPGALVCLVDTYVHVFFPPDELERFRALVDEVGAHRDLDWISTDPLVPMGPDATSSVLGVPVPGALLERGRREGVFGVVGRLRYRGGRREAAILGLAHPGAAWLEWIEASEDDRIW